MSELEFVKYCPLCGAENPRQQAFCLSCFDGDLSTVPVEPRRQQAAKPRRETPSPAADIPAMPLEPAPQPAQAPVSDVLRLELVDDPAIRFSIRDGQTVGRTDKSSIVLCGVPKLDWISSAHAKFFRRNTQWYVQHIAETNFIKVDGETFQGHEEVAIYDGSIVVLSLTAFRVGIT